MRPRKKSSSSIGVMESAEQLLWASSIFFGWIYELDGLDRKSRPRLPLLHPGI